MLSNRIILLIATLVALAACKKRIPFEPEGCEPLPNAPAIGWMYIYPDTGISAPCYNPENPDEIIYREHHYTTGEFWLCKLNLSTLNKDYIFQGSFWSYPKWGKNDWIIFTLSDANIYKIKSDGSELTQVTSNGFNFNPGWSYNYEKIHFASATKYEDTSRPGAYIQQGIGITIDLEGKILDTIWSGWGKNSIPLNDSIFAFIGHSGLCLFNFKSEAQQYLYSNDPMEAKGGTGIFWLNSSTLIWSRKEGIFRTDINSGVTEILRLTCESDFYLNPSYSPHLNKVIWVHVIRIPKGSYMDGKTEFVVMNPDGTCEEILKLP